MRRKDREITGRENIEPILRACKTCRVAMIADGAPYVVPLNFGYTWDDDGLTLYFHSGLKGKKIDALRADPRVCFELDTEQGVTGEGDIACRYSFAFSSIVGYGSMEFAKTPDEKRKGERYEKAWFFRSVFLIFRNTPLFFPHLRSFEYVAEPLWQPPYPLFLLRQRCRRWRRPPVARSRGPGHGHSPAWL